MWHCVVGCVIRDVSKERYYFHFQESHPRKPESQSAAAVVVVLVVVVVDASDPWLSYWNSLATSTVSGSLLLVLALPLFHVLVYQVPPLRCFAWQVKPTRQFVFRVPRDSSDHLERCVLFYYRLSVLTSSFFPWNVTCALPVRNISVSLVMVKVSRECFDLI
jgi:hypothetical protein